MTLNVLYLADAAEWPAYERALSRALAESGVDARLGRDIDPALVDFVVFAPQSGPAPDFGRFGRLRAVLSLWAGVEEVVTNPSLTQPLARMADAGLREGMVEWVAGHVLRHHLGTDAHVVTGQDGVWRGQQRPPLARSRTVAILGLGALGQACGQALAALNFGVMGWARHPRQIDGVDCRSGPDGLRAVLGAADMVVLLLPLTAETRSILNAETLALLPRGCVVINPGRGALIDDDALLAALDSGQVGHATLDVFRTEPLPPAHPFWSHPRVTVTPHIASATRVETASEFIAENIARVVNGLPLLAEVDRRAGY